MTEVERPKGQNTVSIETTFAEYSRAIVNILEDAAAERDRLNDTQRAALNILEDFSVERDRLADTQTAVLNILDDFGEEKERLEETQKAVLNILDDFSEEKERLEQTQKAVLNILEDFDSEKTKVQAANRELLKEIAERREAEQALARSNADLEQFAYVASHDLQEPLRMVSSYVQLFAKRYRGQIDVQADKYIDYAVEGATRMQQLIAGLLEYSRAGRHAEDSVPVAAEAALERALYNLRAVIEETHVVITRDPLPAVMADTAQLSQVFQNLVGNAIKFRRTNGEPTIHIGATRNDKFWTISVKDNGIGIDQRYLDRIFAIFQRLHTRNDYPGTGIGLSICKKVIERHGGRIWVESAPNAGSTFRFALRAARE